MDVTPTQVANASFRTVRKGYDPDEVDAFLAQVANALEQAQQQATAMEARARAAVSRLQEVSASAAPPTAPPAAVERPSEVEREPERAEVHVPVAEAETISRTLLLAQRTADAAIADAEADASRIREEAQTDADATIDSTREMAARLLEDARTEARKATEAERAAAENEVQSLVARREFLIGDVDQLERFLVDQRERLRGAARQIEALCDRVPAGLGHVNPPVLSASDDSPGDDTAQLFRSPGSALPDEDGDEQAAPGDDTAELDETEEIVAGDDPSGHRSGHSSADERTDERTG